MFLGIICDTVECRFEASEDKLEKLEAMLTEAIDSDVITSRMLEKLAGKCTSLSVAVPVAALYTHHMYRQIAIFQRTGGRKKSMEIDIPQMVALCSSCRSAWKCASVSTGHRGTGRSTRYSP